MNHVSVFGQVATYVNRNVVYVHECMTLPRAMRMHMHVYMRVHMRVHVRTHMYMHMRMHMRV